MRQMMRPYQDVLKNLEFAKQLKEKYDEARIDNAEEWNSYACDLEEKFSSFIASSEAQKLQSS